VGFGYGPGKVSGQLGLALITGSSNCVNPKADLAAFGPAMNYLAAWSVMAGLVFLFLGFETKGMSPPRRACVTAWCRRPPLPEIRCP
jgi:putative MFS transporter